MWGGPCICIRTFSRSELAPRLHANLTRTQFPSECCRSMHKKGALMPRLIYPSRRDLLKAGTAGAALAALGLPVARAFAADLTVGFIYVGPKDDYGYNQAHAEGAAALAGDGRRDRRRRRERPRDGRRPEDHGEHDQSGWRDAGLPDLLRLFRPAHAGDGGKVSRTSSSAIAAASGRRASTRRTPAPISAISAWASI